MKDLYDYTESVTAAAKKMIKKVCCHIAGTGVNDIISNIEMADCEIVSFDIFDTLIKRKCGSPHNLFYGVAKVCERYGITTRNYVRDRIAAEKNVRKEKDGQEVTLSDIYWHFCLLNTAYEEIGQDLFMKWEIEEEKKNCYADPAMKNIYDWVAERGYKILLTSDMYLDIDTIKTIVKNTGYEGYEDIYLSSERGYGKNSGYLFKCILAEYALEARKVIHIGDNPRGDYFVPRRMKINAILKR